MPDTIIFRKDESDNRIIVLKSVLFSLSLAFIPVLIDLLFSTHLVKNNYFFIVGFLLFASTFDRINTNRLHQLTFNNDTRQVVFYYKSLLGSRQTKAVNYEHAILEIMSFSPAWYRRTETMKLYFLKNKAEIFEIAPNKDSFTIDTLKAICQAAEQVPLKIKRI
ncbi:MAG: hypothetical protein V4722_21895 [Bacteroidota bacterium]